MSIIFKAPPPWAKSLHVQFVSNQNMYILQLEFIIRNKKPWDNNSTNLGAAGGGLRGLKDLAYVKPLGKRNKCSVNVMVLIMMIVFLHNY